MRTATGDAEPGERVDIRRDEGAVGRTALGGVHLAHLGELHVAIDRIELGQQRAVTRSRRHRRIGFFELDLCAGARQALRDDGLHRSAGLGFLLGGERAQIAPRDRLFGDDVGLAAGADLIVVRRQRRGGARRHHADVERQIPFGQRAAEFVEDPRQFIGRAIAERGAEHGAAVSGLAGRGQRPAGRAAAGDGAHVAALVAREILILQRDIGPFAGRDQIAPCNLQRFAGALLVPGQHDLDVRALERARCLHRAQRGDDHHDPALVVANAGAAGTIAGANEFLEGRFRLEHRVKVADQQQPLAFAVTHMGRDQMPGTTGFLHVDPLDLEAERLQLCADHLRDLGHAIDVERARVLVDQFFEQGDVALGLGLDGCRHLLFDAALRGGGKGEDQGERGESAIHGRRLKRLAARLATLSRASP
eukprot:Opistho-1_new@90773